MVVEWVLYWYFELGSYGGEFRLGATPYNTARGSRTHLFLFFIFIVLNKEGLVNILGVPFVFYG